MKKFIIIILAVVFFSNCSNRSDKRTFERTAVIYNGFEEKRNEKFTANVDNRHYNYVSKTDTAKTVNVRMGEDSQFYFGPDKFILSDRTGLKAENLSDNPFNYYDLEDPIVDGTGPILFNEDYGLLAIYNVFGPTIIFLNDDTLELRNQILDSIRK